MPDLNEAARQTLEIAVANNDDVHVVVFIVIVDVNHYYVVFFYSQTSAISILWFIIIG